MPHIKGKRQWVPNWYPLDGNRVRLHPLIIKKTPVSPVATPHRARIMNTLYPFLGHSKSWLSVKIVGTHSKKG